MNTTIKNHTRRLFWVCVLAGLALSTCRETAVRECTELLEAESYGAAVARCEQAFEETGDPRAGAAAARAHQALGHGDAVLAWVERLEGTAEEAGTWNLAARIHWQRGHRELAAEAYRRALALHREAGDHAQAARSLYGLFYLAWESSEYRQALTLAHGVAEEASMAQDRAMEATALQAILTLRYDLGDLDGAQLTLDAAQALNRPEDRARLLSFEGVIRLDQGRPALAGAALEQALELATGDEEKRFFRSIYLNLARAKLELDDPEGAGRHLASAWEYAEPDGQTQTALLYYQARLERRLGQYAKAAATLGTALSQDPVTGWAWKLEYHRGLAEEARGENQAAEAAFENAAAIVEELRSSLEFDEFKAWLLDQKRQPFEALFRLQADAGRSRAALATVERAKARTFLDAFIHAAAGSSATAPEAAADRPQALRELLPAMSESAVVALRPLEQVLEAAGDRHFLVYFDAGDRLWLITVAGRRIVPRPLAGSTEVEELVRSFLAHPDDPAPATALGEILLPPGSLPERGSRLYVVADSELGRLPFAALRRKDRFLVEDHEITYVPSLNALAAIDDRPRQPSGPPAVLGDPRGDLHSAALEAREVAARLGIAAHTGGAATAGALAEASDAQVLHLAAHTGIGPRGPWLALADGEVSAAAVVDLRLAPRLVVLASCASAARRGRGMWGSLGAAFLAAGSEGVLASLWSIEDEPARRFLLRFYDEGGAVDAAAALARAQQASIAAGEPPSFWAPFVLFGSSRPGEG